MEKMDLSFLLSYYRAMVAAMMFCTLFSLVQSQNELELEHNFRPLADSSLLTFSDVGEAPNSVVRCLASRQDCCRPSDTTSGEGLGRWISPNGSALSELQGASLDDQFYIVRANGSVDLYRRNATTLQEGIYTCEIPGSSGQTGRAYVGLYRENNGKPEVR